MNIKEKRKKFNQDNILNAASTLFTNNGFESTTMDDIAKESEYSKSTVYVYFKSKDDIFNHILLRNMILLKEIIKSCTEKAKNFIDGYYLYCNKLVKFYDDYPLYFEAILGEIAVDSDSLENDETLLGIYNIGEETNYIIEKFILNAINNKELRPDILPIPTTFVLWSNLSGLIPLSLKKEEYIKKSMKMTREEFLKYGFDTLLNSLLNK